MGQFPPTHILFYECTSSTKNFMTHGNELLVFFCKATSALLPQCEMLGAKKDARMFTARY